MKPHRALTAQVEIIRSPLATNGTNNLDQHPVHNHLALQRIYFGISLFG
jgi:hypothetical protein